jgi:hypothetical protein
VGQCLNTCGRQPDAVLVIFDLFWQTNLHKNSLQ